MKFKISFLKHTILLSVLTGLSACGGGGSEPPPPPPPPPPPVSMNTPASFTGEVTGSVTEDDSADATGSITVTDPDANEASVQAQTDVSQTYGSFSISTAGAWSYTLDNTNAAVQALNTNDTLTESISISSVDGATQIITITINGVDEPVSVNTPATFSGDAAGSLNSGDSTAITGSLRVTDPDSGEAQFIVQSNVMQNYGSFSITSNGDWTYVLDNSNNEVQGLTSGQTLSDVITLSSVDMSTASITITINPANSTTATFAAAIANGSIDEFSLDNGTTSNRNDNADAWDMTPPSTVIDNTGAVISSPYFARWNNTTLNSFIETISLNNEAPGTSTTRRSGAYSIKLSEIQRRAYQPISVEVGVEYTIKLWVRAEGAGELSLYILDNEISDESTLETSNLAKLVVTGGVNNNDAFQEYELSFVATTTTALFYAKPGTNASSTNDIWIDDVSILTPGFTAQSTLNPNLPPSGNFDLSAWKLQHYLDEDGNGRSDEVDEEDVANGYTNSDFFYTASDGGMVFRVPVAGAKTSPNTSFTRTELREMLRRGNRSFSTQGVNKNNWVFGSAPEADRIAAGGVDGIQTGTLAVNHVTTTGDASQVGRVIFAQIHANDDEPIRFYYRKLPTNTKGSIYFAHEPLGQADVYFEMIGSRSRSQSDPADGIALDEVFSYEIKTVGNIMTVTLIREGKDDIVETVDMSASGYDAGGQYMYFKAGAYIQDNTGDDTDYAQVTYYKLDIEHNP